MTRMLAGLLVVGLCGAVAPAAAAVAQFTVQNGSDLTDANPGDGQCDVGDVGHTCTLRAAIQEANAHGNAPGEADEILLLPQLYKLSIADGVGGSEDLDLSGDLDVWESLTIRPLSSGPVTIDAQDQTRIFHVLGGLLTLEGITLRGGNATQESGCAGGGGAVCGPSVLSRCTVTGNRAKQGGGLWGATSLTGVAVAGNSAEQGGGVYAVAGSIGLHGSSISQNTATTDGGGLWVGVGATIDESSTVSGNAAQGAGGGLFLADGATLALTSSEVTGNSAKTEGGGLHLRGPTTLTGATVSGNQASQGGGIFHAAGELALDESTVAGNKADGNGGGIDTSATLTLRNSTVRKNESVGSGGGIAVLGGGMRLAASTVSENTATAVGGGLALLNDIDLDVRDSTISTNTATCGTSDGTGRCGGGLFHASACRGASCVLQNVTIAKNQGDGIVTVRLSAPFTLSNSIVVDNAPEGCQGSVASGGYDLLETCDVTGVTDGNITDGNGAALGPLQDNGGPTATHDLSPSSPARDHGSGCEPLDQRGYERVGTCDIGAVEFSPCPCTARWRNRRAFRQCVRKRLFPTSASARKSYLDGHPSCGVCPHQAPDWDCDGVDDAVDNCRRVFNPGQLNTDEDLEGQRGQRPKGDACDQDDDGDGVLDRDDNCPLVSNPSQKDPDKDHDQDNDGVGNECDRCADTPDGKRVDRDGCAAGQQPAK